MHFGNFKKCTAVLFLIAALTGYGTFAVGEFQISPSAAKPANPALHPYEARSYPDKLEIYRADEKISLIRSEKPDIQRWGFIDSGNLVVVESRGEDGSIVYELFDTATGELRERASAGEPYTLPVWAAGSIE